VILHIKAPKKKKTPKILRFAKEKTLNKSFKENPKTLCSLSLKPESLFLSSFDISRFVKNLKQLKNLTYLNIDMDWLPDTYNKLKQFFSSFHFLKNLKVIYFYTSSVSVSFLDEKLGALRQIIRDLPSLDKVQIKLSFSVSTSTADYGRKMLRTFVQFEKLTSVNLNMIMFRNLRNIQEFMNILKNCDSLNHLSLTFDVCTFRPINSFLAFLRTLNKIKSLNDLKIHLKKCDNITGQGFKELVPILKELAQEINLEMIFDNCLDKIKVFEWWSFAWSVRKLKSLHKIRVKFIGKMQGLLSIFCHCLLFFLVIVLISAAFPVLWGFLFAKT